MQAVRIHPASTNEEPYSVTNPADSSALVLDTIDIPKPGPDEILVKVHATTVIRDTLTWPEMYAHPYAIPGHDFAGTVAEYSGAEFKAGDPVYGMVHADRGQCWADYVLVKRHECAVKPANMSYNQAATVPLSALTAWQALFHQGGVPTPTLLNDTGDSWGERRKSVFITGASGGVGIWLVQLAKLAGCHVVAGTTSRSRSETFLKDLGADEVVEYDEVFGHRQFDTVIDSVAGEVLERCWSIVKDDGYLVSIHSLSFTFVEDHRASGIAKGKDDVKASFFIVEPSGSDLTILSRLIEAGKLRTFVGEVLPLSDARKAYELCHGKAGTQGKIVLVP